MKGFVSAISTGALTPAQRRALQDLARRVDALPRGIVARGNAVNTIVALPASPTVADLSTTIRWQTEQGRQYRLSFVGRAAEGTTPNSSWLAEVVQDGSAVFLSNHFHETSTAYAEAVDEWVFEGDGSIHTWKIQGSRWSGSVNLHLQDADYASHFYLEDMGATP